MTLSIIVTNYKTHDSLRLCLASLFTQKADFDFEVIVVDIEAEFENGQIFKDEFPDIVYIGLRENSGFSRAVNTGLKKASGNYHMVMNADIVMKEKDDIARLVSYCAAHHDIGILAPSLLNFDRTVQQSYFRFYTPLTILLRRTFLKRFSFAKKHLDRFVMKDATGIINEHTPPFEPDWVMGAVLLFQKGFFEKAGMFDERFFMYFEDVDIARRAKMAGLKVVYYPAVQVFHYHQKASAGKRGMLDLFFNTYSRIHLSSAIKYFFKYGIK